MMRSTRIAALAASTLLLAACGSAAGQVTTNGAADKPVSLTGISYSVVGRSGGDQLVKFTELASALSNGTITISPGPQVDSGRPDTSAEAIAAVRENRADLAIVSARTFDTLGVTTFQALQAPYVVTSHELADKVLADPIAEKMLDGTKQLGLVGIGLAFDFLAYPASYGAPLLGPDDYRGKSFQVRPSKANEQLVAALGATSDLSNGQDLEKAVAAEKVAGGWGYFDGPAQPVGGMTFTANEPAFARANVIVVNEKVFAGLSATQQQSLRDAAAQTRDWMATRHTNPVVAAASYCSIGAGAIVLATDAQLQATKAASLGVVAALEKEPVTAQVLTRIRELAAGLPVPPAPSPCSPSASGTSTIPVLKPKGDQGALDGVWRLVVDAQDLVDAGASQLDASNNEGTWTWTFDNGTYTYVEPRGRRCSASYTITGTRFLAIGYEPGCDLVFPLVYTRSGDTLRMKPDPEAPTGLPVGKDSDQYTPDPPGFSAAFLTNPLVRVGDAP